MKLTKEQLRNIEHALMHLKNNGIADPKSGGYDGWFVGNKDYFIRRHKKAIEMLKGWSENGQI